eukprot:7578711-Pyramimonas_sp.AAC.1
MPKGAGQMLTGPSGQLSRGQKNRPTRTQPHQFGTRKVVVHQLEQPGWTHGAMRLRSHCSHRPTGATPLRYRMIDSGGNFLDNLRFQRHHRTYLPPGMKQVMIRASILIWRNCRCGPLQRR